MVFAAASASQGQVTDRERRRNQDDEEGRRRKKGGAGMTTEQAFHVTAIDADRTDIEGWDYRRLATPEPCTWQGSLGPLWSPCLPGRSVHNQPALELHGGFPGGRPGCRRGLADLGLHVHLRERSERHYRDHAPRTPATWHTSTRRRTRCLVTPSPATSMYRGRTPARRQRPRRCPECRSYGCPPG